MSGAQEGDRTTFTALLPLVGLGLLFEGVLLVLVWLFFRIPDHFSNIYAYAPMTRRFFAASWGFSLPQALEVGTFRNLFAASLLALYALWLIALGVIRGLKRSTVVLGIVLGLALLFQLTAALAMPPVLSTDIYNYIAYARMMVFHDLNPMLSLPAEMTGDPIASFPAIALVSHYGPTWLALTAPIAWLSGWEGIWASALGIKVAGALANIAIAYVGYRLARGWGEPAALATALFLGWHPLFLLEGAANGHNDLLMMALALAGLLAYQRRRPYLGYLLLLLSFMVKFVTLLLVALYALAWLREQEGGKARLRLLLIMAGMGLLVVGLGYAPFLENPGDLLSHMAVETQRYLLSPAAFLREPLQQLWVARGWPEEQALQRALLTLNLAQKAGLVALLIWGARRIWTGSGPALRRVTAAWGPLSLIYVLLLHPAITPWYLTWNAAVVGAEWYRPALRRVNWASTVLGAAAVMLYGVPF